MSKSEERIRAILHGLKEINEILVEFNKSLVECRESLRTASKRHKRSDDRVSKSRRCENCHRYITIYDIESYERAKLCRHCYIVKFPVGK